MDLPYPSRDNDRERGRPSHSYRELPELPPDHTPSYDPESLPEGVTEEDAETAERMTLAATPGCRVFSPMPYEVCGAILQRYEAMGGPNSWLGLPNSPEYTNPDGVGKRSQFINGSIYWHPHTGAHPVTILYMTKWNQFGWEMGWLGYPTGAEIYHNNGGSRQEFQGAGLFWSQPTGVYAVGGAIRAKYNSAGGAEGPLGYPTTDELTVNKYDGRYNNFTNGTITWSGVTGARLMYAAMRDRWAEHGREDGQMGYPLSDVQIAPDGTGRYLHFEDGSSIYWHSATGAWRVPSQIIAVWSSLDWEKGPLGYPMEASLDADGFLRQIFALGEIAVQGNEGYYRHYPFSGAAATQSLPNQLTPADESNADDSPGVDVMNQSGDRNEIIHTLRDSAGRVGPLRRGYWNGVSGFGVEKIYQRHEIDNMNLVATTMLQPGGGEPSSGQSRFYRQPVGRTRCDDSGTCTTYRRDVIRVVVDYRDDDYIQGDNKTKGVITAYCESKPEQVACDSWVNSTIRYPRQGPWPYS
ncbi:LGFP repeat-containing protein [Hoyosella altamirensis]|nr:LGFP repeat-containing protein [Hoyosella altamirensis]